MYYYYFFGAKINGFCSDFGYEFLGSFLGRNFSYL